MAKEFLLLTPGPTTVPRRILEALALPAMHHRTKDYQAILERVNAGLKKVFLTENPVMTFASSGTGAMEASITNLLSRGDTVLSFSAGKWGERYRDIARVYGLDVKSTEKKYGMAFEAEEIREALKKNPGAKAVLITLCETSTGVVHPIESLAHLTRDTNTLLMVDAISGLLCDPLKMDAWGVDVTVCGSQKGFMLPPGLSFVALSQKAAKKIQTSNFPKYYFNFSDTLKMIQKNDTPFTPAVSLVRGLEVALAMALEEGLENVWARHARIAAEIRSKVTAMGLTCLAEAPSNALTAIHMPLGIASKDVIRSMREEEGVIMADGQGELQGKIVRFAHMGASCTDEFSKKGFEAFQSSMTKAGYQTCQTR